MDKSHIIPQVTTNSNNNVTILRYKPHKQQKLVHESNARFKIICAGRRAGKSLLCAADLISRCLSGKYTEHDQIAWIAPTLQVAQRGVDAFKLISMSCPNLITWYKSAPVSATFPNGVKVLFLSADNPEVLRGYGFAHLVCDEADYLPSYLWEDVLRASLADKKGTMIAISSPRAKNTWFYNLYNQGLSKDFPHVESFHFPSSANPLMTEDEIEDARQTLPETTFKREYLAEWTDSGGEVFQKIDDCIYNGHAEDCQCNSNTIIGVDLAKHMDFTVMVGLCPKCRHVKFIKRFNDLDWTIQKKLISNVYINTTTANIILDTTGIGDVIYDDLVSEGLKITPFRFTNPSKQQLINNLRLQIMEGNIKWRSDLENANILKHELESYEIQQTKTGLITYNGRTGVHDDCVIALGLACNGLSSFISPIVYQKEEKTANDFAVNFVEVDNGFDFGDSNQVFFG